MKYIKIFPLFSAIIIVILFGMSGFCQEGSEINGNNQKSPAETQIKNKLSIVGPKIKFTTPTYNFGRVPSGPIIEYVFEFKNTGDDILKITKVKPSCGCTATGKWDREVAPGQFGKIPIQMKTNKAKGKVKKSITISSNTLGNTKTVVYLEGEVWEQIQITPRIITMSTNDRNQPVSKSAIIKSNLEETFKIESIESSNELISISIQEVKPGKEFKITATAVPPIKIGSNQSTITMKTTHKDYKELTLKVNCYVSKPLTVSPPQFRLPSGPLPKEITKKFTISNRQLVPIKLEGLTTNIPGIQPKLTEITPGKLFNVEVKLPEGFEIPAGEIYEIKLKTNHPDQPEIKVRVVQSRLRKKT